jgi:peptide/nickel transport system permease protein
MLIAVLTRVLSLAGIALVISILVFGLLNLSPNDAAVAALGPYADAAQRQIWLSAHGYLQPMPVQYMHWLKHFLSGNLGQSQIFLVPVGAVLWPRLANSMVLMGTALALMVPLALALGVVAGFHRHTALDRFVSALSIVTTSLPPFATAALFSALFTAWLHWLPGTSAMIDGFDALQLVLPAAVLVTSELGYIIRITRASTIQVMKMPYIRAARLRGLGNRRIMINHVLKNTLITPFTVIMLQINWLLGGLVVVESFFAYKGIGSLLYQAAMRHDTNLEEACTMVLVVVAGLTQLLADLAYGWLDPRVKQL